MILRGRRMESGSSPSLTSSDYGDLEDEPDWQIIVSSLDGTASRELTQTIPIPENGCWANPSWSPDGTRIAASLLNCYNEFDEVWLRSYLFPVGTGPPRVIVGATPPVWSPDGTKLAFLRQYAPEGYVERTTLYVARGDGSQARSLSVSAADPWGAPVWAPKGGRLAYASEQTGQIETIAVDGSGRRRVTHEPGDSVLTPFAWSADARRILYEAFVSPEHSHIWTMSPAGTGFKRLTRSRRDEGDPAWSPDGRQDRVHPLVRAQRAQQTRPARSTRFAATEPTRSTSSADPRPATPHPIRPGRRTESGSPSCASHSTSKTLNSSSPTQTEATCAELPTPATSTRTTRRPPGRPMADASPTRAAA